MEKGDKVKLNNTVEKHTYPEDKENHKTAIIQNDASEHGSVLLDRDLGGSNFWNLRDLEKA